jgi:trehalose utilization protein
VATPVRVTIWNEYLHEKKDEAVAKVYPKGIHGALADHLKKQDGIEVVATATLEEPEHGLTEERLAETDVLLWWAHIAHGQVEDAVVDRVQQAVLGGMGLVVLHSGHAAKVLKRLMGTRCGLQWREVGEKERLWVVLPGHPIADGLPAYFELPHEEMYGEVFDIPQPDELVLLSWFEGGEVFRSGCCWHRGRGKVFYFRPGHETYPTYYDPNVLRVITNACRWAARCEGTAKADYRPLKKPLSPISGGKKG